MNLPLIRRQDKKESRDQKDRDDQELTPLDVGWMLALLSVMLLGGVGILMGTSRSTFSFGLLLAGASLLVGVIIGLLFGIPRALQYDRPAESPEGSEPARPAGLGYRANTNLEQISDWLTKILVGVGLTQLDEIPGKLRQAAAYLGPGLGTGGQSERLALSILGFFSGCGFLFGYLWTRVFLPRSLVRADLSSVIAARIHEQLETRQDIDALALSMVERWLDEDPQAAAEVREDRMREAIKAASPTVKVQIFYMAKKVRTDHWKNPQKKWLVERTIPIFQALIESAPDKFHRNYGQLGYAFKDQPRPNWKAAEEALTRAIELRGPWDPQRMGWSLYEINRAICRIHLDPNYPNQPAASEVKAAILADLRIAAVFDKGKFLDETPIKEWMALNTVTKQDLLT